MLTLPSEKKYFWEKLAFAIVIYIVIFVSLWNLSTRNYSVAKKMSSPVRISAADEKNSREKTDPQPPGNADKPAAKKYNQSDLPSLDYTGWLEFYGLDPKSSEDADNDGLSNRLEYRHLTDPTRPDTDADGYSDRQEIINGYDPAAGGDIRPEVEISIGKLNIAAPVIWSKSYVEKEMQESLKNGTIHLHQTASPGQPGTMVITGHSSNYAWVKGAYNQVFENLDNLAKGDRIIVKTTQKNGRIIQYQYSVNSQRITAADDQTIFSATTNPSLSLVTCWPVGTNSKRLVVKADLVR